jgi:hypothetical protein
MDWLGQPAQASACPAAWDSGPGQCSGSGALSAGVALTSGTMSIVFAGCGGGCELRGCGGIVGVGVGVGVG